MRKPGKLWVKKVWAQLAPSLYRLWERSQRVFSKGSRQVGRNPNLCEEIYKTNWLTWIGTRDACLRIWKRKWMMELRSIPGDFPTRSGHRFWRGGRLDPVLYTGPQSFIGWEPQILITITKADEFQTFETPRLIFGRNIADFWDTLTFTHFGILAPFYGRI